MIKSTCTILFFLLVIALNGFSQSNSPISKKEIYFFLKEGFFTSNYRFILIQEPLQMNVSDTTLIFEDSIFSQIDKDFIINQLLNMRQINWEPIKNCKLMKKASHPYDFWDKHNDNYKKFTGVAEMSVPLFSLDRSKCMILYYWYCGEMCGDGGFFYYQKIKGKWELITRLHNSYR
jgi:hypothetical protein